MNDKTEYKSSKTTTVMINKTAPPLRTKIDVVGDSVEEEENWKKLQDFQTQYNQFDQDVPNMMNSSRFEKNHIECLVTIKNITDRICEYYQNWKWFGLRTICSDYKQFVVVSKEVFEMLRANSQSTMIDLYRIRGDMTDIRRQFKQENQDLKDQMTKLKDEQQVLKDKFTELDSKIHFREFLRRIETAVVRNPLAELSERMYQHGSFKNAFFEINRVRKWISNEETIAYEEKNPAISPTAFTTLERSFNMYFFDDDDNLVSENDLKEILMKLRMIDKVKLNDRVHPENIDEELVMYAIQKKTLSVKPQPPNLQTISNPWHRKIAMTKYNDELKAYSKEEANIRSITETEIMLIQRFGKLFF